MDYTPLSGPQRVRDLLPDEAEELLAGRYAIIQASTEHEKQTGLSPFLVLQHPYGTLHPGP